MKKIILLIIVIAAAVGFYLWWSNNKSTSPKTSIPVTPSMALITYTDLGYTPASLSVKAGEMVVFKNESSNNIWPASANHPTHNDYPTTGGCLGSTFDACKSVPPGQAWSFKFEVVGSWKYHDHLNPKYFGSITVE